MSEKLQRLLTILCGVTLVLSWIAPFVIPSLALPLAVISVLSGSVFALREAWESVLERQMDVHILMVLAGLGAVLLGHWGEAAVLLFLFSLSNTLEEYALGRTKSAIEGLMHLRPSQAILVTPNGDTKVPVEDVKVGDHIRVLPFEHIPLDGAVLSGASHVNQATMTGESEPVAKAEGETVLAGTQNLEGMIVVRVTTASGETMLEKIVDLVRDAQENKASGERISQWFGSRYTWFVIVASIASLGIRLFVVPDGFADWEHAAYASLTLLVALSPCALVISTPATTLSALAWAGRKGVLVRGGQSIEHLGMVDTLVVDKTGTLTQGRPELAEVCVCSTVPELVAVAQPCEDEEACWHGESSMRPGAEEVLRLAAAAEQYSTHPLAEAIVRGARTRELDIPEATRHEVVPGLGVIAEVDGRDVRIGQPKFFDNLPLGFQFHADEMRREGMTVAIMEADGRFAALGLRDQIRPDAASTLAELRDMGVSRVVMLTGDNEETAQVVASQLGLTEVHASLMPADKERLVSQMVDQGATIAYIGDGVNDAPSLARAHVGIAMGGLGSDIALNAADIVLMQDRLGRIPEIVRLGRKTNKIIRANLFFAGGVIAVLTLSTVLMDAFAPQLKQMILPMAVVGHEGSTVLVILNGLRLLRGPGR